MSCHACDEAQLHRDQSLYVRVGVADVEVFACQEHAAQLIRLVRQGYRMAELESAAMAEHEATVARVEAERLRPVPPYDQDAEKPDPVPDRLLAPLYPPSVTITRLDDDTP